LDHPSTLNSPVLRINASLYALSTFSSGKGRMNSEIEIGD
jgi:hypothetical protein